MLDFHAILGFEIVALQALLCPTENARAIGGFDAEVGERPCQARFGLALWTRYG